ncbi:unnamed protein product [Acanthoscelides obtectus]|nr:unnamed protein product [Acanthoscelides obtectus]CAK1630101.1 Histone-lysine N-methyltransferase SMYD3 [Acanthoscelides obtectus]
MLKTRDIAPGDLLFKEKPFVYVLSSRFRTERCDNCLKKNDLLKCSGCHYTFYCNKSCQKDGWAIHKLECKYLKSIGPRILPDAARMLARILKILEKGGGTRKTYYDQDHCRTFKDLMSHYDRIKEDQLRVEHVTCLYGVLFEYFNGENVPSSAELMEIYGKMCINSFNICSQELQSVGTGIYLGASILDHSCKPNVVATFESTEIVLRALEKIPVLDWSKMFISYIDVMALKKERQSELESAYYFLCQCPSCVEPEPIVEMMGMACPNKQCKNCIDSTCIKPGQKCSKCKTEIKEEFIREFNDIMDMTNMHLDNMKGSTSYLDVCKVCLKNHEGLLYKYNIRHVKILDLAFDSCIDFGKFDDATQYGLKLVNSFHKYYGKKHPLTGLLHLKLGKLLMYQDRVKEAVKHLQEAKSILQVTHGITSSLFREQFIPLYKEALDTYERIISG